MATNISILKIPLNKLYYISNIDDFNGLDKDELKSLKSEYDELEFKGIVGSVKWAVQNPNYDFLSLAPDLQFNNSEIYRYICVLEKSLFEF